MNQLSGALLKRRDRSPADSDRRAAHRGESWCAGLPLSGGGHLTVTTGADCRATSALMQPSASMASARAGKGTSSCGFGASGAALTNATALGDCFNSTNLAQQLHASILRPPASFLPCVSARGFRFR